jgi:hypothetical protein
MGNWVPTIYRGDGAWIGRMASGRLGVGLESEERASLKDSCLRPMWPFMERSLPECFDEFATSWTSLTTEEYPTIDRLFSATIQSAWESGREYWMRLAVNWLASAQEFPGFDLECLRAVRDLVLDSSMVSNEARMRGDDESYGGSRF